MARIEIDPNYSSPTFSRATASTDLFKKEDVESLAAALSTHTHGVGKGLPVTRLGTIDAMVDFTGTYTSGIRLLGTYSNTAIDLYGSTATVGLKLANGQGIYSVTSEPAVGMNLFYLNSANRLVIGQSLAATNILINIDGTLKFLETGAANSGGAGYKMLRIAN